MNNCKPSDYYETPPDFFKKWDDIYDFEWDVCASHHSTKVVGCYFDEYDNGLTQDWYKTAKVVWCNPPYSKEGKKDLWIKKAYEEAQKGVTTVMLLPVKTSTKAFHAYIYKKENVEVELVKGRIKFWLNGVPIKGSGRFDSMVVVFKGVEV